MEPPYDRHMGEKRLSDRSAIGAVLSGAARRTLAEARAVVAEKGGPDATAVHEFRKGMKRWRALLRLLEPLIGDEARQLRTEAGNSARALALARDSQACLDALDDLAKVEGGLPSRIERAIRKRIRSMRREAEASIAEEPARMQLVAALDDASAALERWSLEALAFDDVAEQLTAGYRRARKARPGDWDKAKPEALHRLRRRVVVHRYHMELIQPLCPKFAKSWVARAQNFRQRLGKCQDLDVLVRYTAPGAPLASWSNVLRAAAEERMLKHRLALRRLCSRFFSDKPKAFRRRLEVACRDRKAES